MRARLAVRIGPDDVGRRVTVRARYHGPEAAVVDVVGTLLTWGEANLTIERRDGSTATVAHNDLVAARVVGGPPAPRGRADAEPARHEDPDR